MRRVASLLTLTVLLTGCALGRIHPGGIDCLAVGHAHCRVAADGAVEIQGGALSNNLSETLAAALAALGAYFGVGAL